MVPTLIFLFELGPRTWTAESLVALDLSLQLEYAQLLLEGVDGAGGLVVGLALRVPRLDRDLGRAECLVEPVGNALGMSLKSRSSSSENPTSIPVVLESLTTSFPLRPLMVFGAMAHAPN